METWTGVLAFAGQIYGDFAGYTDMAIGIALVLGFTHPGELPGALLRRFPRRFLETLAHLTLESWLRDYVYISLGGNRNNKRWRNVMITMLLGGLWHGAAWTFVVWGAFHGMLITVSHGLSKVGAFAAFHSRPGRFVSVLKCGVTLYLVLVGWVLFRAQSLEGAGEMLASMHGFGSLPVPGAQAMLALGLTIAAGLAMHLMDLFVIRKAAWLERKAWLLWPFLVLLQTLCLLCGAPSDEFIYFQF